MSDPDRSASTDVTMLADRTPSPMVLLDEAGTIRHANAAAGWLAGRPPTALVGVPVLTLVHPDDRERMRRDLDRVIGGGSAGEPVEYRVRTADGTWKTIAAVGTNLLDVSSTAGILISATDVTDQRAYEQSLRDIAHRSAITGLANRVALHERLVTDFQAKEDVCVAFVGLDHFRRINDCLGHTVGDAALKAVGARLAASVPTGCAVAHFGADLFVVVLIAVPSNRAIALMWELIGRLAEPLFLAGNELRLSASAGVAFRDTAATPDSLLRDADAALTRAKSQRRGGVEVFTEAMRTEAVHRLALEIDLRHAVDRNQLRLYLQPVVRLATGRAEGNEALLRWERPDGDHVDPSTFIALAEETGLIVPIGDWVLTNAVNAIRAKRSRTISVNLSPKQLLDPALPSRVERLLNTNDLRAERLGFEITEAVVVINFELATECLNRLRGLGCIVGLDDFGTGYSSLGYLRRLPVDFLKLDRELVADVDTDPQAAENATTIVNLARTLSLTVVAEGVERQAQADVLNAAGCHYGQGWLFGRPAPP